MNETITRFSGSPEIFVIMASVAFGIIVGILIGYIWTKKGYIQRFKDAMMAQGKLVQDEVESIIDVVTKKINK